MKTRILHFSLILAVLSVLAFTSGVYAQNTVNYMMQGGDHWVVGSGGTLEVKTGGTLTVAGVTVDASTLAMTGLTATAAELNKNAGVTAGTAAASKTAVLGANKNLDTLVLPVGGLYIGAGAGTSVTSSAAELNILTGVTATASELNKLASCTATQAELSLSHSKIASFSFSVAAGASNVSDITITPKDAAGSTVVTNTPFFIYLSDAATGLGLSTHAASGGITVASGEGAVLDVGVSGLSIEKAQAKATAGTFVLEITDAQKTAYYVCAISPFTGSVSISTVLSGASYGA